VSATLLDSGISDLFALAVNQVENLGSVSRIVFSVPQVEHGEPVNVVICKIVVPTDQLLALAAALRAAYSA
jgi:hypothetical protein